MKRGLRIRLLQTNIEMGLMGGKFQIEQYSHFFVLACHSKTY
jgi:hypothetical protein